MPRILITGGTGFIGRQLTKRLEAQGNHVSVFLRNDKFSKDYVKPEHYQLGDLQAAFTIRNALEKVSPDIVVHLAGLTPVRYSFDQPNQYTQNYENTVNIVQQCLLYSKQFQPIQQFVYASTAEVYGPLRRQQHVITEETPPRPLSPYAISKYAGELYVQYAGELGLPITIMRSTNTFGRPMELPEEAQGYFVEKAIIGMLQGSKLAFDGDPHSERSWMHVDDHVSAYMTVIGNPRAEHEIFNVSTNELASCLDVTGKLRKLTGYTPEIEWNVKQRPIEPNFLDTHARKIFATLGWKSSVSLDEGLARTVAYWRGKL